MVKVVSTVSYREENPADDSIFGGHFFFCDPTTGNSYDLPDDEPDWKVYKRHRGPGNRKEVNEETKKPALMKDQPVRVKKKSVKVKPTKIRSFVKKRRA